MDERSLKEKIRIELEKLKLMSLKDKIGYIWDYYKPLMAGIAGIAILIFIIAQMIIGSQIVTELSVAMINATTMGEEAEQLQEDFTAYAGLTGDKQQVIVDSSFRIDLEGTDQMTVGSQTKLMAMISGDSLDVMIMPEEVYRNYLVSEAYMDLKDVLGEEFLNEYQEFWCQDKQGEQTSAHIYGLKVAGNEKLKVVFGAKPVVISVVTNAKNTKNALKFVQYLLS